MKTFLIFVTLLVVSTTGINLLVLIDEGNGGYFMDPTIVQFKTVSYITNVTRFSPYEDTPTLEFLTDFDCVLIVGTGGSWHDSVALGNVLVQYMKQTRGGVVTTLSYYDFRNDLIEGDFAPYNIFRGWYPSFGTVNLFKAPNNTNSYSFNTSNLAVNYYLSLTRDQMLTDAQILWEIDNIDDPAQPYIGVVTKTLNFDGMQATRTDLNFRVYSPDVPYSDGYQTNDTLLLITDALLRASRPCVTQCIPSITVTADDSCMAAYPPFACDNVVQLSTGSVAGVDAFTLSLVIDGVACNTTMNVVDTTPPILECPGDFEMIADHCNVTVPEILFVNVTDNCDATVGDYTQSPAAGSIIGIGVNKIIVSASDMYGNVGTCTVQITVKSSQVYTQPPTLYCPSPVYSPASYNCESLVANYEGSINATDECGVLISWSNMYQTPWSEYPVINGSILITVYATDDFNNTNYCEFYQVTRDEDPPQGYCGNGGVRGFVIAELDEQCYAEIGEINAYFYDNCFDGELPHFQSPNASEMVYGVGSFSVSTWATDTSGNTGYCFVDLLTFDAIPPTIHCPDRVTINGLNIVPDLTLYVNGSDNCKNTTYNQTLEAGTLASIGTHNVEIFIFDVAGNYASCNVTVTFIAPNVTCPSAYTYDADSSCSARVPNVEVDPYFTVTQHPAANSTISKGVTSLNVTVTDPANVSTQCITTITVLDKIPPILTCVENITVINVTNVPNVEEYVTYSDSCGNATLTQFPAIGALVTVGNHTLNVTVTDNSGNTATCLILLHVKESGGETPIVTPFKSSSTDGGGGLGPGAIAGIVIGVLVGLCLIIGLIVAMILWRRRERKEEAFFSVELVPSGGGPKSTGVFKAK